MEFTDNFMNKKNYCKIASIYVVYFKANYKYNFLLLESNFKSVSKLIVSFKMF